jgi:hypothetical protein
MNDYTKEYYKIHRKSTLKKQELYRKTHKIEISKRRKKHYESHKEESKEYYELNKNKIEKYHTIYNLTHKDKLNAQCRKYSKIHKKQRNEYERSRRSIDINYKLRGILSTRIWSVLKGKNKSSRTMKLVGCTVNFLKQFLQKQFKSGMSWSNYGKWHIDHIKPCASFDLSKPSEQRECFNYTNLQPLWAEDNLRKSDKI